MNSIRPQTVTLAAVAIVFGLVAAYGAKRLLEPKPVVDTVQGPKMAAVVVAQTNLTEYARIGDRDVEAVEAPAADIPPGSMRVRARAVGRLVKSTILAGYPIREQDLYEPGMVPRIADQLPPGYRAVTLKVEDAIASNGAIQPGSLVDVSLTFDSDHPEVAGTATVSLIRGLKVLTPAPATSNRDPLLVQGGLNDKTYITVAATPEQANRLFLAQKYGTLNVTLCSSNEKGGDALAEGSRHLINKFELLGLPPVLPPLPPVVEPPVRKVVEIYRGTQVHQVVFNEAGELLSTEFAMSPPTRAASFDQTTGLGSRPKSSAESAAGNCPTCKGPKKVSFAPTTASSAATSWTAPAAAGASLNNVTAPRPTLAPLPSPASPTLAAPRPANL
jgi:pilus assembly protein CpaB